MDRQSCFHSDKKTRNYRTGSFMHYHRALHAESCSIFYFLISCIKGAKTAMQTYDEHEC